MRIIKSPENIKFLQSSNQDQTLNMLSKESQVVIDQVRNFIAQQQEILRAIHKDTYCELKIGKLPLNMLINAPTPIPFHCFGNVLMRRCWALIKYTDIIFGLNNFQFTEEVDKEFFIYWN
jgi:hypothetical protein